MYFDRRILSTFDWRMAGITLTLVSVGIITIWSGNLGSPSPVKQALYLRQSLWFILGIFGLLTGALVNYRTLARFAYPIFGVLLVLLLLVYVVGEAGYGAQRWIRIGAWSLQPSEFMKLALIIVLARYFEDYKERLGDLRLLVVPAVVAAVPIFLILRQPDLGTAALLGLLTLSMLLLVGLRVKHLLILAFAGATLAPVLWSFLKRGRGTPTTGITPSTIPMLTTSWTIIIAMIPKAIKAPKRSLESLAISSPRVTRK